MLMPKKTKYRKSHKGKRGGKASRMNTVAFGEFGIMSTEACWVTARQIEATRRVLSRYCKKTGKVWIRVFPHKPVTQKSGEVPMGKGKGGIDHYVVVVKPGMVLFEMDGVSEAEARIAITSAGHKLPVKTEFIVKKA
ncbi:MAG: 50S ribosomal protein L16 [bacterium]